MLCPETGKYKYKTYFSAARRLKYEKLSYRNKNNTPQGYVKGGIIYKCKACNAYHITRHTLSDKVTRSSKHAKRLSK